MLAVGDKAPLFTLPDGNGKNVSLTDYAGKKVVLYFYPKDMTSGCTTEACEFRDAHPDFAKLNVVILGVSADSVSSHKKFSDKYDLPFTLLSDETKETIQAYGVWVEKSMYGRKYMGIERSTFIIDESGKIQKIFLKVKVNGHIEEVRNSLL
ncbi:MAG: thioredoxin-dependent thiol peroxidase [Ignavibacteriales bacterium]|nr:thioredoxin-dependent thiol peroxidase [Ignavibacteriales bacterium]MCF8305373.1 thioredoxin-dependent thiol peroxidase [Ignavibacteriales bacterium]MCF8316056.1 thioredoxin-dependent thiol peroxidase [Ignavibacteriales bacterium]MCF8436558.1 thioredoxin-dependent thiol peroxidase [Ignavibacteriales bacterium]